MNEELKSIPKVDAVLKWDKVRDLEERFGPSLVKSAVRASLKRLRENIRENRGPKDRKQAILKEIRSWLADAVAPSLRRVINGTGIIIHTNLGRAVLPEAVLDHIRQIGTHYANLEYDLATGKRGHRDTHAERLLARFFDVESACVVNNNAAAVMLMINTFAEGREVVVSRGELIEIGGSFRIPDIMEKAGARLVEVGTTNKTHLSDYEQAISERTGLVLKVHPSNYRITGFTESVPAYRIAALCRERGIPFAEDMGSGNIFDLRPLGIQDEPRVTDSVREGTELVSFSGDKLLGGVQSGIIVGKLERIAAIRRNHLLRALRVDKLVYAAIEKQMILLLSERWSEIPTWRMLFASVDEMRNRAIKFRDYLPEEARQFVQVIESRAKIGGGTTPEREIPSVALAFNHPSWSCDRLARAFRKLSPPVIGRIEDDVFLLDMRTLLADDLPALTDHVRTLFSL